MDSPNTVDEFWEDSVDPPDQNASVRIPSFKELASQIKQLQKENFQLKLRVHLTETRGVADPITSTTPKRTPKDIEIEKEYNVLKKEKEQLEKKLRQNQSQLMHEMRMKDEIIQRESTLQQKYSDLKTRLDFLETESKHVHPLSPSSPTHDRSSSFMVDHHHHHQYREAEENWVHRFEEERKNYLALESELCQVRNELQAANNDRLILLKQLKTSEAARKKDEEKESRLKESLEQLISKNKCLRVANDELRTGLEKFRIAADERAEALRKRAVLEMSNQLYYHQTALEKVHKEQGLLIAELQMLKKSCPFKLQTALKLCQEIDEKDEDVDTMDPLPLSTDSTHFVSMPRQCLDSHPVSKQSSGCKMNIIEDYHQDQVNKTDTTTMDLCEGGGGQHEDNIAYVNRKLYEKNSKLAIKLRKTRESLKNAISMLEYSEKDKAGMEKIICRQLHKTHTILAEVKETLVQSRGGLSEFDPVTKSARGGISSNSSSSRILTPGMVNCSGVQVPTLVSSSKVN